MSSRPMLPPEPRRILDIARRDRVAATRALAELPLERQVALLCETPVSRRAEILDLFPFPEQVVPEIPEAELCFTVKAIGLADASWLIEYATPEQLVACLDLDTWNGLEPDLVALDEWLDALADTSPDTLMQGLHAIDPEVLVIYLRHHIAVAQKPDEKEGWDPPAGFSTLDGQFYFGARAEGDDLATIVTLLKQLFESDYWLYFRMMQANVWELDDENLEWALRWRTGRLQDLGFPPWREAMDIYRFIPEGERGAASEDVRPLEISEWHLPAWVPQLPAAADSRHLIFRTIPLLDDAERRSAFYAFAAVANKVAVADGMKLGDASFAPRAIDKSADFISVGLAHVASARRLAAVDVLRRVSMERLFRVGANLDPDRARR